MSLIPVQPWKALEPILVTLLGIVTEVKPLQEEKASSPIFVTLLGIVIELKPLHPEYLQPIVCQRIPFKTVEK